MNDRWPRGIAAGALVLILIGSFATAAGCEAEADTRAEGVDRSNSARITNLTELEHQMASQLLEQLGEHGLEAAELTHIERPHDANQLILGVRYRWSPTESTSTAFRLHQVANRYYLGTVTVERIDQRAHVMLTFE